MMSSIGDCDEFLIQGEFELGNFACITEEQHTKVIKITRYTFFFYIHFSPRGRIGQKAQAAYI